MKKILFSMAAAALLLNVTSCQNEDIVLQQQEETTSQEFTLQATYGKGTRTTLEENGSDKLATKWSAGDQIFVTDGSGLVTGVLTLTEGEGESTGSFSGIVTGNPAALKYAIFPVPADGVIDLSKVDAGQVDAPMTAEIYDNNAAFSSGSGLIELTIYNLPDNAKVTLSAKGIAGTLQAEGCSLIPVTPADEIIVENAKNGVPFYVPVVAGDEISTIELKITVNEKTYNVNVRIKKGSVSDSDTPDLYVADDKLIKWDDYTPVEDPDNQGSYSMKNATDLLWIADQVNEKGKTLAGMTMTLTENIDVKGIDWSPIGTSNNRFKGSFDGNGKTISNLHIDNGENNNAGFFGYVEGSKTAKIEIKNVVLENVEVKGGWRVGGLIGNCGNYTTVSDITVKGLVKIEGYSDAGAVVGATCKTIGNIIVNVEEGSYVKSMVGTVGGVTGLLIENYHAENITSNINVIATDVIADKTQRNNPGVGGVFGCTNGYGTTLTNCSSSGDVTILNAETEELAQKIGGVSGGRHGGKLTLTGCSYTGNLASSYNGTSINVFNNQSLVGGSEDSKNIIVK